MVPEDDTGAGGFDITPRKRKLVSAEPRDIPEYVLDSAAEFVLYVRDHALMGIREYACQDTDNEVGGILLGERFQRDDRTVVIIRGCQPVESGSRSRTHFTFDSQALLDMYSRLRQTDEYYVVGWFHSHPRLGDPFMSQDDENVHTSYFKEPWFVSCVVGSGEWALPLGFWRMKEKQLIHIGEHFVQMTFAKPVGEQTRRYFRAAIAEERPLQQLMAQVAGLKILSEEDVGSITQILEAATVDDLRHTTRSGTMSSLVSVMDFALRIAKDQARTSELEQLAERLRRLRFLEDAVAGVVYAEGIKSNIVAIGNRIFSVAPGEKEIICCDILLNLIWPAIVLDPPTAVNNLVISTDRKLWAITAQNQLVDLSAFIDIDPLKADKSVQYMYRLPELDSDAREIAATAEEVCVRTEKRIYRLDLVPDKATRHLPIIEAIDVGSGSALIVGSSDGGMALTIESGVLRKIDRQGEELCRVSLGEGCSSWAVSGACSCSIGILVLFDDGHHGQLMLFDKDSLALIHHYTRTRDDAETITSITVDEFQRAFVKRGIAVSLLTASGSPSHHWYHFRNDRKRRFSSR